MNSPQPTLIHLYLTGGLGNQLFQISAALSQIRNSDDLILVDTKLGNPRSTAGKPDLLHFELLNQVVEFDSNPSVFMKKVAGFLLRMGIFPRGMERNYGISWSLCRIGEFLLSLHFRKKINLRLSSDVGFCEISSAHNPLLLGYFQSYRYLEQIASPNSLMTIIPRAMSSKLNLLIELAKNEQPIFVHYRFQDYLVEKNFGIPGIQYYRECLEKFHVGKRRIWVFSDDQQLAKQTMPQEYASQTFFVDDEGLTPAEILHLFRYGTDYVIANSSFSWWGASLTFSPTAKVMCPSPWFFGMPEPRDLISPSWTRVSAYYD